MAKQGIAAGKGGVLDAGNGDQETIKRIPVRHREWVQGSDVSEGYRENLQLVRLLLVLHYLQEGPGKVQLPQLGLNLNLPDAGNAQDQGV